jgi:hypothetical protein
MWDNFLDFLDVRRERLCEFLEEHGAALFVTILIIGLIRMAYLDGTYNH